MSSDGGNVQVSDAVFELDDLKGSGGITVTFSVPLSVVMQVESRHARPRFLPRRRHRPRRSRRLLLLLQPRPPARAAGPSVGLKAKIARLIWNKETIGGIDVDIALRGDTLRLNDVKVSNLAGARLAVRGTVANYSAPQPRPDIAFNFEAPDMDRVLKLAGATPAGLGAVTASRRHRRQPRAAGLARARRERRRPEPARDRHAGLARRGAGRAQVGGIQGQPDAERPDHRRLDRSDVDAAGPTSPPTSGPTCSISTRSAAALLRHRARRRAASRPRAKGDRHGGRCAASTATSSWWRRP